MTIITTIVALVAALSSPAAASWQDDAKLAVVCADCAGPHSPQFALIVFQLDGRGKVMPGLFNTEADCRWAADWPSRYICVQVEDTE